MKTLFLNLFYFFSVLLTAQTNPNIISEQEYADIEINNVRLEAIQDFQGDVADISQLFGLTFTNICNDPAGEAKTFHNTKIEISYHGFPPNMDLRYFELTDSSTIMEWNGASINLGDNISVLNMGTNLNSFELDNNTRCAIFKPYYESSYICIEYDSNFNVINKIYFLSPT